MRGRGRWRGPTAWGNVMSVSRVPEKPSQDPLPGRPLTTEEFEMVIRRAAELQARSAEESGVEGVSEDEVLRIGRELGLSGTHLGQALAEVRSGGPPEQGVAARIMGDARCSAARAVPGEAPGIARVLEQYLVGQEFLVVQRRLKDRTVFVRASGIMAVMGRAATGVFRRAPLLNVEQLEVSVRQLDPAMAYVVLSSDLRGERRSHLVVGSILGGAFGTVSAVTLGIVVAAPAALVAVPIVAAGLGGMRYAYRETARKVVVQLESVLDRLEHGELHSR
jgi:hypothetical protein